MRGADRFYTIQIVVYLKIISEKQAFPGGYYLIATSSTDPVLLTVFIMPKPGANHSVASKVKGMAMGPVSNIDTGVVGYHCAIPGTSRSGNLFNARYSSAQDLHFQCLL